jgi:hypothetical protein
MYLPKIHRLRLGHPSDRFPWRHEIQERISICPRPISCPGHCDVLGRLKRKLLRKIYVERTSYLVMVPCNRQGLGENGTSPDAHLQLPWASFDWAHPHGTLWYRISVRSPLARYGSRYGGEVQPPSIQATRVETTSDQLNLFMKYRQQIIE